MDAGATIGLVLGILSVICGVLSIINGVKCIKLSKISPLIAKEKAKKRAIIGCILGALGLVGVLGIVGIVLNFIAVRKSRVNQSEPAK